MGWTAEQTSCTSPGSVSSALRAPPPSVVLRLEHGHADALARERHRAGQPVRARAHDDRLAHAMTGCRPLPVRVTSTGKSKDSSSHGPRLTISATSTQPSSSSPAAASWIQ